MLIELLYGSFKIIKKRDYVVVPLKVLYAIFTLPALLVGLAWESVNPSMPISKFILNRIIFNIMAVYISVIAYIRLLLIIIDA